VGVFENRVLRKISGPKRDKETEERRRLHDEELHDMYSSTNIIREIKSRTSLAGHVAPMERRGEVYTRFSWGNLRQRNHLENRGVDGRKYYS